MQKVGFWTKSAEQREIIIRDNPESIWPQKSQRKTTRTQRRPVCCSSPRSPRPAFATSAV